MKPEKEKPITRKRDLRLDIIRSIAAFSVISVHFFSHIQYYETGMKGGRMFLMTLMRMAFMVCVPLFLMLTGYLMHHKQLKRGYYKGILKTLGIYILAALAYQVSLSLFTGTPISLKKYLFPILEFSGYGWYIEMYIGLFLLIPFLNAIWRGLKGQKQKMLLIATLLALTTLPSLFNIYDWHTPEFWQLPSSASSFQRIVPAWWLLLYPLTYYFIGAYLQEYGLKLRAWADGFGPCRLHCRLWGFPILSQHPRPFSEYAGNRLGRFSDSDRKRFAVPSPSSDKSRTHPPFFPALIHQNIRAVPGDLSCLHYLRQHFLSPPRCRCFQCAAAPELLPGDRPSGIYLLRAVFPASPLDTKGHCLALPQNSLEKSHSPSADQGRIRSINSPKKQPGFRLFFVFLFI